MTVAELSGALALAAADAVVDELIAAALAGADRARVGGWVIVPRHSAHDARV